MLRLPKISSSSIMVTTCVVKLNISLMLTVLVSVTEWLATHENCRSDPSLYLAVAFYF